MEVQKDEALRQAASCLPAGLQIRLLQHADAAQIEEVRLRAGRPPAIKLCGREKVLDAPVISADELRDILSRAARYSVHSYGESLKNGFITLDGGHRLGVCGTAVVENGEVSGLRGISSLDLRVARQIADAGAAIQVQQGDEIRSTLLLSPPGWGKTTLLRELARRVSDSGETVAIADERSEIAALLDGVPQFAIGTASDVIEGCSKKQAAMMLLKTMSPTLLVLDEITAPADVEAVALCAHCGVCVLASAHAKSVDDLSRRALYRALLELKLFRQAVVITMEDGKRNYSVEPLGEGSIC